MNAEDRFADILAKAEAELGDNGEIQGQDGFAQIPNDEQLRTAARSAEYRKILDERAFDASREPPEIVPVFKLNNITISTPGNLTSITSTIKTGKSALIGAMMASAMNPMGEKCDYLGIWSCNPNQLPMLHFDSEQPPSYYWHCIKRAIKRADLEIPPPWFHSFCLTGLNCRQAFEVVQEAIRVYLDPKVGLHSIFLDGIADMVPSVNDEQDCNAFVQRLLDLSIECNCPTIGVIHFNPGTEKTRGHLGSQFERKAETNLRLDKDENDVTTVWSDKQRLTPIPKTAGLCFSWNKELGMHTSTENPNVSKKELERAPLVMLAEPESLEAEAAKLSQITSDTVPSPKTPQ